MLPPRKKRAQVYFLEDVSMPPNDEGIVNVRQETALFPLPQSKCDANPLKLPNGERTGSKTSVLAFLGWQVKVYGVDAVTDTYRSRDIRWRDIDIGPIQLSRDDPMGRSKLNCSFLGDQGSGECRFWQQAYQVLPGHAGIAYCHRLHNNARGISPATDQCCAKYRTTLRAPKGSGEMQGRIRVCQVKLKEEALVDSAKCLARPFAPHVLKQADGKNSLAEALEKGSSRAFSAALSPWIGGPLVSVDDARDLAGNGRRGDSDGHAVLVVA
mmetsp:Transcript_19780/g.49851  ORF Transcript_19780/g.49851 Transcript_19780/m.49851 type:complete len:269 (-) Transcript_19780:117-923(-)